MGLITQMHFIRLLTVYASGGWGLRLSGRSPECFAPNPAERYAQSFTI